MSANRGSTLRAFCGEPFPWTMISALADGTEVVACYLVHERRRAVTKTDKPYLDLRLGDRTGTIAAKVWDQVERWEPLCAPDGIIGVRARVSSFREELQLTVVAMEPLQLQPDDLRHFVPASPRDPRELEQALDDVVAGVGDPALRALLLRCLDADRELGRRFRTHPAATRNHHAYLCGLLEHSVSVADCCAGLAEHYRAQRVLLDRDLLIAGALLHDIGKTEELGTGRTFRYTDAGRLLGHIVLGIQIIAREAAAVPELPEDRLLLLQHLVASHQGRKEWASPAEPQTLEALILHYADDLDAKVNAATVLVAGVAPGEWTERAPMLTRQFFRPGAPPPSAESLPPELRPVDPEEAVGAMIDLFHG